MQHAVKYILTLFTLLPSISFSQATVSGNVSVGGTGIPGVNIYIQGTVDGSTSDSTGKFSFVTNTSGEKQLVASMIGMETKILPVILNNQPVSVKIIMQETATELNTVVISAGNFEAGDVSKTAVLNTIDIVTTAGATADVFGALRTLPGVVPSMEESGMVVRGGDVSESKTFFNGILVNKPFTSELPDISQRGRFSPFMFKGTSFSTGAFSAIHGNALSSVVQLESKDLATESHSSVGIMSVGLDAGHTQLFKNSSLEVNGSYYNLEPVYNLIKQNTDWTHAPEAAQGNIFYKHKTGENGIIKIYGSYEQSHTGLMSYALNDATKDSQYDIRGKSLYLNATISQFIKSKWKITGGAGFGNDKDDINIGTDSIIQKDRSFHGRFVATRYVGKLSEITTGAEYFYNFIFESLNHRGHDQQQPLAAVFTEAQLYATRKLVFRPGIRFEYAHGIEKSNLSPRVALGYLLNDANELSAGTGVYSQLPSQEYLFDESNLDFEKASHLVLTYQFRKNKRVFRSEVYYKKYDNLVLISEAVNNNGYGYARGIDIFYRDNQTIKHADLWGTFSLIKSERKYRDYPVSATPPFVANVIANAVGKYFNVKWSTSIGVTYTYASGKTYYNPNSEKFLSDRTNDYHNFSINASYLTHVGKMPAIVHFSLENVFGIKNVYGYRYSPDGSSRTAVTPAAPRNIFLGIFLTINGREPDL